MGTSTQFFGFWRQGVLLRSQFAMSFFAPSVADAYVFCVNCTHTCAAVHVIACHRESYKFAGESFFLSTSSVSHLLSEEVFFCFWDCRLQALGVARVHMRLNDSLKLPLWNEAGAGLGSDRWALPAFSS